MGKKSRNRSVYKNEFSLSGKCLPYFAFIVCALFEKSWYYIHFLFLLHIQAAHIVLAQNPENSELSRFYASTMKSIGMKLLCKLLV